MEEAQANCAKMQRLQARLREAVSVYMRQHMKFNMIINHTTPAAIVYLDSRIASLERYLASNNNP